MVPCRKAEILFISFLLLGSLFFAGGCARDLSFSHAQSAKQFAEEDNNYDAAVKHARKATRLQADYAPGWYWLGYAQYKKGQYEEAIKAFNKVIELESSGAQYESCYYWLGESYYALFRYEEAVNYLSRYLSIRKDDYQIRERLALELMAWCYYFTGHYQKAVSSFNQAIGIIDPANTLALLSPDRKLDGEDKDKQFNLLSLMKGKAFAYLAMGDSKTALGLLDKASTVMDVEREKALMYYALGDKEKAWEHRGGAGYVGLAIQWNDKTQPVGLQVVQVLAGGPADKAGITAGDTILGIGENTAADVKDFVRQASRLTPGSRVNIKVIREGIERKIPLVAGSAESLMENDNLLKPVLARRNTGSVAAAVKQQTPPPSAPEIKPPLATHGVSQHWALIIGVGDYADSRIADLRYADRDADAFYNWLVSREGGRLPPSNVKLLINKQATMSNIKHALFVWLKQALEEDVIIIYYAGHGSPDSPDSSENLFLLPHDADFASIATSAFPMWDIQTALERFIKADKVIVIADACHSGGVGMPYEVARRSARGMTENRINSGLTNLSQVGSGVCVISASDDNQMSQESKSWGGGHGVFTYYLLEGLNGEADYNKDNRVSLGEIIPYLSENVRRATRNSQSPTVSGKFDPSLGLGR